MKNIICPICGMKFDTTRPNKKYCSFSCREAGRRLQRLKWNEGHPNYISEYMRSYRKRKEEIKNDK